MIGGGGEKKTLRLVATYADACNLFAGADAGRRRSRPSSTCCAGTARARAPTTTRIRKTVPLRRAAGPDTDAAEPFAEEMPRTPRSGSPRCT